jgi:hypothetical protein
MSIWEKTVVNVERGSRKITAFAATFSERIKAELAIIRLQVKIDELLRRIDDLHRMIGARVVDLKNRDIMPKTTEQLFFDDEITAALSELADRVREIEGLRMDMAGIKSDFKTTEQETEEMLP